jgi:hypothetical protein
VGITLTINLYGQQLTGWRAPLGGWFQDQLNIKRGPDFVVRGAYDGVRFFNPEHGTAWQAAESALPGDPQYSCLLALQVSNG